MAKHWVTKGDVKFVIVENLIEHAYAWNMRSMGQDVNFLLRALDLGGAVVVSDAAARASLQRVGYMTPAPKVRIYGRVNAHTMALTKRGKLRAEEIQDSRQKSKSWVKYMSKLRNRVIHKNDVLQGKQQHWWYR